MGTSTYLNGLYQGGAVTGHTLEESLLVEDGVGGPTSVTSHILPDVTFQSLLNLLLMVASCK